MPKFRLPDFDFAFLAQTIDSLEELYEVKIESYQDLYEALQQPIAEAILDEVQLRMDTVELVWPTGNFGDCEAVELMVTLPEDQYEQLQQHYDKLMADPEEAPRLHKRLADATTSSSGFWAYYQNPVGTPVKQWPHALLGCLVGAALQATEWTSTTWQERIIEQLNEKISNTMLLQGVHDDCDVSA